MVTVSGSATGAVVVGPIDETLTVVEDRPLVYGHHGDALGLDAGLVADCEALLARVMCPARRAS